MDVRSHTLLLMRVLPSAVCRSCDKRKSNFHTNTFKSVHVSNIHVFTSGTLQLAELVANRLREWYMSVPMLLSLQFI